MKGFFPMLAIALVLAAAGGLYGLKHRVEARREAVQDLERQILRDSEAIRVLKAEWAYLTNPELLQQRAQRYLTLAPPRSGQITTSLARLPFRGRDLVAEAGTPSVPQPRMKPMAPPRPTTSDHLASAASGELRRDAHPASTEEDFAARIRAVLERMGGEW